MDEEEEVKMVFLDMDGVLVDFIGGVEDIWGKASNSDKWDLGARYGVSDNEVWQAIAHGGSDFWKNLRPTAQFPEIVAVVREAGTPFYLATSPSLSPDCARGKTEWIQKYFGRGFRDYFITPKKELLSQPGRFLVDDRTENCREWDARGGTSMLYPQPWNSQGSAVEDPLSQLEVLLIHHCNPGSGVDYCR